MICCCMLHNRPPYSTAEGKKIYQSVVVLDSCSACIQMFSAVTSNQVFNNDNDILIKHEPLVCTRAQLSVQKKRAKKKEKG